MKPAPGSYVLTSGTRDTIDDLSKPTRTSSVYIGTSGLVLRTHVIPQGHKTKSSRWYQVITFPRCEVFWMALEPTDFP